MRTAVLLPLLALAACATSGRVAPTEVIRYHLPAGVERGTATVEPAQAGLMSQPFEQAVARQLELNGYPGASGVPAQFVAVVGIGRRESAAAPRRSPVTIGIGGGGFSGGRGGGFGLGGGIGFPVGGARRSSLVETELSVLIKRRADQTTIWEGHARTVTDLRTADAQVADKLAAALFTGFPGESGRTISVP